MVDKEVKEGKQKVEGGKARYKEKEEAKGWGKIVGDDEKEGDRKGFLWYLKISRVKRTSSWLRLETSVALAAV